MPRCIVVLALWLLFLPTCAHAFLREIDPHSEIKLGANEGLLLVSVNTLTPLHYVRVQREGNYFASAKISDLNAGVTTKIYAVAAGKYRWDRVGLSSNYFYELSNDAEFKFEVKAGVVNYPGDLLFRSVGGIRGRLRTADRALGALDWLETSFPSVGDLPFVYVGHYPDPFAELYRKERVKHPEKKLADLEKSRELPKPEPPSIPIQDLWQASRVSFVALNTSGDLLAESIYEKGKWGIDLIDLRASDARRLVNPPFAVASMRWLGDRTLIASLGKRGEDNLIVIVQVEDGAKGRTFKTFSLPYLATLVGTIPSDPTQLLVASSSPHGQRMVHQVDIRSEATIKQSVRTYETRFNKGLKDDFAWFTDGSGQIRAALVTVDKQNVLLYGGAGEYQELMRFNNEDDLYFWPYRLSTDGNLIYGFAEAGRSQRDFVAFDPQLKKTTQTLFSREGTDTEGVVFNRVGNPIGASYYDAGHLVVGYFDDENRHLNDLVAKAFPDKTAVVLARNDDGKVAILGVDGSDYPFALYQLNAQLHRASLVDEAVPSLSKRKWLPSIVIKARGKDGLPVEAYLTLPNTTGKRPMIVLAHGGPIGVRDERHFDPEVQFLAGLGYAVLQVNFRGSEGYGTAYRKAGLGSFGSAIEDDVDAAVDAVLGRYPVDASRMCAMGTSYGGYSALQSAIRHPERFRCVISISGPTDWTLSFTASDVAYSAAGRRNLEKYIGDPIARPEEIARISPVYRVSDLKAAVLIVHGTEDERVDYENARRLVRMLNLAGHTPAVIRLDGEGHGITTFKNLETAYPAIAAFLKERLADISDAATLPATSGGTDH